MLEPLTVVQSVRNNASAFIAVQLVCPEQVVAKYHVLRLGVAAATEPLPLMMVVVLETFWVLPTMVVTTVPLTKEEILARILVKPPTVNCVVPLLVEDVVVPGAATQVTPKSPEASNCTVADHVPLSVMVELIVLG